MTHLNIPAAAVVAYKNAATVMHAAQPSCHLTWGILAGIGQIESNHGRFGGATILANGMTSRPIVGPRLDGHGVAKVPDTDGGRLDGDKKWDRAVGPMQFIPTSWAVVGVDADHDDKADPNDLNDAALAAGVYLCASGRNLSDRADAMAAVETYNHSVPYARLVLRLAKAYDEGKVPVLGESGMLDPVVPGPVQVSPSAPSGTTHGTQQKPKPHNPTPRKPKPSSPTTTTPTSPAPTTPTPAPPTTTPDPTLKGVLVGCADGDEWCIGAVVLDFGEDADLSQPEADYDGDGTVEAVNDELLGLAESERTVTITLTDKGVVKTIDKLPYTPPTAPTTPTTPTTSGSPTVPTGSSTSTGPLTSSAPSSSAPSSPTGGSSSRTPSSPSTPSTPAPSSSTTTGTPAATKQTSSATPTPSPTTSTSAG